MKLHVSRKLDYAVRILSELARHGEGVLVPSRQIAKSQHIPFPYLQKIVNQMASVGLVETHRGKEGGVTLRADPNATTLLDIIHLLGEIDESRTNCVVTSEECPVFDLCRVHSVWEELYQIMLRYAAHVTLAELVVKQSDFMETPYETHHNS